MDGIIINNNNTKFKPEMVNLQKKKKKHKTNS